MPQRILIVEDDADTREMYVELLGSPGLVIDVAADGMDAIFKAKAAPPSLVVMDVSLPRLDGIYVADVWSRDPQMSGVPVIAVSGFFDAHNQARAREAGCIMTLAKPFSPDVLLDAVHKLLRTHPR